MRKPSWLTKKHTPFEQTIVTRRIINNLSLNTVCKSAKCPNMGECYAKGVATFMILGKSCTRTCGFCAVDSGFPKGYVDKDEPLKVAKAALEMNLDHVVVTSVTRDDLDDGGAAVFAKTVDSVRNLLPEATIEVLTPDLGGNVANINLIADSDPDVFNHNLETVPDLYGVVRPGAIYSRSLDLLRHVKSQYPRIIVKSGIMLGFGENVKQVIRLMTDLAGIGLDVLTIGQYLSPSRGNLPVIDYVHPEVFENLSAEGKKLGIEEVFSGPFVRSSFHAADVLKTLRHRMAEKEF
jgi:lipoic acid synthetase